MHTFTLHLKMCKQNPQDIFKPTPFTRDKTQKLVVNKNLNWITHMLYRKDTKTDISLKLKNEKKRLKKKSRAKNK